MPARGDGALQEELARRLPVVPRHVQEPAIHAESEAVPQLLPRGKRKAAGPGRIEDQKLLVRALPLIAHAHAYRGAGSERLLVCALYKCRGRGHNRYPRNSERVQRDGGAVVSEIQEQCRIIAALRWNEHRFPLTCHGPLRAGGPAARREGFC